MDTRYHTPIAAFDHIQFSSPEPFLQPSAKSLAEFAKLDKQPDVPIFIDYGSYATQAVLD